MSERGAKTITSWSFPLFQVKTNHARSEIPEKHPELELAVTEMDCYDLSLRDNFVSVATMGSNAPDSIHFATFCYIVRDEQGDAEWQPHTRARAGESDSLSHRMCLRRVCARLARGHTRH